MLALYTVLFDAKGEERYKKKFYFLDYPKPLNDWSLVSSFVDDFHSDKVVEHVEKQY